MPPLEYDGLAELYLVWPGGRPRVLGCLVVETLQWWHRDKVYTMSLFLRKLAAEIRQVRWRSLFLEHLSASFVQLGCLRGI
jgi:hypothetical protein